MKGFFKKIIFICPTIWDRELKRKNVSRGFDIRYVGNYEPNALKEFDTQKFIDGTIKRFSREGINGVLGTHDYPAAYIAAKVARELNVPGEIPGNILRCQHKYYARLDQCRAVPKAVPGFLFLGFDEPLPKIAYPVFAKPVKSVTSMLAKRIDTPQELALFQKTAKKKLSDYLAPFNQILQDDTNMTIGANGLLLEEVLQGSQVTVEGYAFNGHITIMGVVDSVMYPGTNSFKQFEYPSKLPERALTHMKQLATRVANAMGLRHGMFNIELMYDAKKNQAFVIEVNPRMSYQFASLFESVDGMNSYVIALALACGIEPTFQNGGGRFGCATSFVLRIFHDQRILCVPNENTIRQVDALFPENRLFVFGKPGERLSDQIQDPESFRYAVLNLAAKNSEVLEARWNEAKKHLLFQFTPVG